MTNRLLNDYFYGSLQMPPVKLPEFTPLKAE